MSTNKKDDKKSNNDIYKEYFDKAMEFCKKNVRYLSAAGLFIILMIMLAVYANKTNKPSEQANLLTEATSTEAASSSEFAVDAYPAINELISKYYTAYAAADANTLATLATPMSDSEKSYITTFSQFVEQYQNISCYTKKGLDDSSYIVSVKLEIKFKGVDTPAPGLDFFYVRTNTDGSLYIDNLYSQFNMSNQEQAQDATVTSLISGFEQQTDVIALQADVQSKYNAAIAADANLKTMIETTIPNAITKWASDAATAAKAAADKAAADKAAADKAAADQAAAAQAAAEAAAAETVYATDTVNVRSDANETASVIGQLAKGAQTSRLENRSDGWSRIDYSNGTQGYVKSEYLTTDQAAAQAAAAQPAAPAATATANAADGTTVTLTGSTNIRESMDENSKRVATAYPGEKVTVVQSYAEGWSKVTYNGKTGYVKTELLK